MAHKTLTVALVALLAIAIAGAGADTATGSRAPVVLGEAPFSIEPPAPIADEPHRRALPLDNFNKAEVASLFNTMYKESEALQTNAAAAWSGDVNTCNAGDVSSLFRDAEVKRINFFRNMVNLPAVAVDTTKSSDCQKSALIMSANSDLSHFPDASWTCYSAAGAAAAGTSNIAIGSWGARSVNGYIDDSGSGNSAVGHRRWLFYPPLARVSTGDVGSRGWDGTSPGAYANTIQVIGNSGSRPSSPESVAWPPAGFVPFQLLPSSKRFSFSYPSANFASATASVTRNGVPLTVTKESVQNGYGDNTIVFVVAGLTFDRPTTDVVYAVTLQNVVVSNTPRSFSYQVTVFDPNPPTSTPCQNIDISGRSGVNSGINGRYVNQGSFNGVPAYVKSSGSYYLYFDGDSWSIGGSLGASGIYAYASVDEARPELITVPWLVWNGQTWATDTAIRVTCADATTASTSTTTRTTTASTTTRTTTASTTTASTTTRTTTASTTTASTTTASTTTGAPGSTTATTTSNAGASTTSASCPAPISKTKCKSRCAKDSFDFVWKSLDTNTGCPKFCKCKCPAPVKNEAACVAKCVPSGKSYQYFAVHPNGCPRVCKCTILT